MVMGKLNSESAKASDAPISTGAKAAGSVRNRAASIQALVVMFINYSSFE
jgi:hypothetical protein